MSILLTFLRSSRTQRVLNRKPKDAGFSLIELVVVVAVLAILSAIAIPAFTSINDKARASAAANTLATLVKECAVKHANGASGTGLNYNALRLDGYADLTSAACPTTGTLTFSVSPANSELPAFTYNFATGEKTCTPNKQNCRSGSW